MVRSTFGCVSLGLLVSLLPACSPDGPSGPVPPSGPAPTVFVDRDFGEPPLAGTLRIVPGIATLGWSYRISPIPPETQGREGPIDGVVSVPYRFDAPGVHVIRVELTGPEGPVEIVKPIIVIDPKSDFEILAQRPVEEIWPDAEEITPEGIVMDPAGRWLYAANYRTGELARIDPGTLEAVAHVQLAPEVEGLTVTPSGKRLFAVHKVGGLSVVDLGSFTATDTNLGFGYYIRAIDESHALNGGSGTLALANVDTGERVFASISAGHFAIFPGEDRVASIVYPDPLDGGGQSLRIFALPSFEPIRSIPLDETLSRLDLVAVDPSGERLYVTGRGLGEGQLVVVDVQTGAVLASIGLGLRFCDIFCVANPVVTFASGRYVAFEQGGSIVIVDTTLDLPRFLLDFGHLFDYPAVRSPSGVAAHPDSDILYVLGGNAPTRQLYKIRLRNP